jgi:peptide/nickel transport system permease protein
LAKAISADEQIRPFEEGRISLAWQRYRRHTGGVISLVVLAVLFLCIIFVPVFSPFDHLTFNPLVSLGPFGVVDPLNNHVHVLGTDVFGRDELTRIFYAGRSSFLVALLATAVTVGLGTVIGLVAGYYGGWLDSVLMRSTDFMLALPLLPMYIFTVRLLVVNSDPQLALASTMGGILTTFAVFVIFGWMGVCRLVRGAILSLREQNYIEASRALGAGHRRIIFRHLLPNTLAPVLVAATFQVADFIIWEAILAYFLQGIQDPPVPSWGNMLANSLQYVSRVTSFNPFQDIRGFLFVLPISMIFITVICINYIGDTLRDMYDPRRATI